VDILSLEHEAPSLQLAARTLVAGAESSGVLLSRPHLSTPVDRLSEIFSFCICIIIVLLHFYVRLNTKTTLPPTKLRDDVMHDVSIRRCLFLF
jgi:hypothetical protein